MKIPTNNIHKVKPTDRLEVSGFASNPTIGLRSPGERTRELFTMESSAFLSHMVACWNAVQENCSGAPLLVKGLSERELATVLCALRMYQLEYEEASANADVDRVIIGNAGHFKGHSPLEPEEVDALCERINQ